MHTLQLHLQHRPSTAGDMLSEPDTVKCGMQEIKAKLNPLSNAAGEVSLCGGVPPPPAKLKAGHTLR